ncbi:BolA family transcriptional regulator [Candidatus Pelagibacter sp.]|nr:BolA family transcriptional regulator [Candidatus Pelagibacter sp.]
MNIDELIINVKKKIKKNINIENILIEDKTFLHKNHPGHESNKFHLKIIIKSEELNKLNKIESNKKIYKMLEVELKNHIHSLQILIN